MRKLWMPRMENYLRATPFFDYDHPAVDAWVRQQLTGIPENPVAQIKALYLAVRDSIQYDPDVFRPEPRTLSASYALESGEACCIPKAVLLGAATRSVGIPSRLGLADVRNHLSSPKLIEWLRSDIFRMHGFIELYLNGKWIKATPAFDKRLCELMKVEPLEFDGVNDSIFQEYIEAGEVYMEYVNDHGVFDDVPHEFVLSGIKAAYGHLFPDGKAPDAIEGSLVQDISGN